MVERVFDGGLAGGARGGYNADLAAPGSVSVFEQRFGPSGPFVSVVARVERLGLLP